jgi:hypothetical protein
MQQLFKMVGIGKDTQVDKETVDFIYNFVEKNGGMEAVQAEIRRPPPPVPSKTLNDNNDNKMLL